MKLQNNDVESVFIFQPSNLGREKPIFIVPPKNMGQMVTVSYAAVDDNVIQCRYDSSDRHKSFYISKMLKDDKGDYWNGSPKNLRWRKLKDWELVFFSLS